MLLILLSNAVYRNSYELLRMADHQPAAVLLNVNSELANTPALSVASL